MQTIQSPTLALLAVPAINAGGLENSIVFHQLPAAAQDAIRSTTDPQTKVQIAVEAGDQLPVMAEMYEHYVAAPIAPGKPFSTRKPEYPASAKSQR